MFSQSLPIIFAIIALILLGLSSSFSKTPTDKLGAERVMVIRGIFNVIILGFVLLFNLPHGFTLNNIIVALLISILGYFPLLFFLKALAIGKMGIVSPIASSYTFLTVILAVIFYHEHLSAGQLMAVIGIIVGIILISLNFRDFKSSHLFNMKSGVPFALLAALTWGLYFFLIRIPTAHLGTYFTSFIVELIILFSALTTLFFQKKMNFQIPEGKTLFSVFLVSITVSVGVLFYYQALNIGSVSIISAIGSSTPLIVTLYGAIFMKERLKIQQYAGMAVILLGIIGLSIS